MNSFLRTTIASAINSSQQPSWPADQPTVVTTSEPIVAPVGVHIAIEILTHVSMASRTRHIIGPFKSDLSCEQFSTLGMFPTIVEPYRW